MIHLAIFASGKGSNARAIINWFKHSTHIKIALVISNNAEAGVLEIAKEHKIPTQVITKKQLNNPEELLPILEENRISVIILAGFLLLIPEYLVREFPKRILNIHPALLPKYGGKGMYGMNVHEAVLMNKEKETGITIHLVNEKYDEGEHIAQYKCTIENAKTAAEIAEAIHQLEQTYFPETIEKYLHQLI